MSRRIAPAALASAVGPIAQQTPCYFHAGGEDFHLMRKDL